MCVLQWPHILQLCSQSAALRGSATRLICKRCFFGRCRNKAGIVQPSCGRSQANEQQQLDSGSHLYCKLVLCANGAVITLLNLAMAAEDLTNTNISKFESRSEDPSSDMRPQIAPALASIDQSTSRLAVHDEIIGDPCIMQVFVTDGRSIKQSCGSSGHRLAKHTGFHTLPHLHTGKHTRLANLSCHMRMQMSGHLPLKALE